MLNYIWLALILIGITVAAAYDWHDISVNRYHNGSAVLVELRPMTAAGFERSPSPQQCALTIDAERFNSVYHTELRGLIQLPAECVFGPDLEHGSIRIQQGAAMPEVWKEISRAQRNEGVLTGRIERVGGFDGFVVSLLPDPVRFVRMQAVTTDGVVKYARTAVELAIGLIGIMALWLGIMKIAEKSGLVSILARALRPLTSRLFPDVPPDHPAMGAMVMNISANMLGLANAATPLGLKAMEELNKLNKKLGTATDAMCTFLVINTSNVQLIPATVIAIRAASGSSNPTEIIGPAIVATAVSTIVGVAAVKLLARLKIFRSQLQVEG